MVNVGIIGTGFGAKVHIPGFRAIKGVRVLGITGNAADKTAAVAKELGVPLSPALWKELIDHPEIQAVSIVSPPYLHAEMVLYAALRKKHIFCEKPLAMTVAEGKKMLAAAKRAGVVHSVDFEFRNLPGLVALRELLDKKVIGEIRHASIAWLTGGRASMEMPLSWQNEKEKGGGVLFSHCSHIIDYAELLFGRIKSVSARLTIAKKNGATAEDTCDLFFCLANGATLSVAVSNVLPGANSNVIEVYGDGGSLRLENCDPRNPDYGFRLFHFSLASKKETEIPLQVPAEARDFGDTRILLFRKTAENFIGAIEKHTEANPSFADGLRVQEIMDAARKSANFKKEVSVG